MDKNKELRSQKQRAKRKKQLFATNYSELQRKGKKKREGKKNLP